MEEAKAAIEEISLDGGKTITENIEALEEAGKAILDQAQADLEAQRDSESHSTPTGLEEGLQNTDSQCKLVLRDGVMYIIRDGKIYLLTGQSVQ